MLQRFGRRDPLYFSGWGRGRFAVRARANLARLVAELRNDPLPADRAMASLGTRA